MKKNTCRIVTFHTPINFGAVLQATALFTYVSRYFRDTKIIDYDTKQLRKKYPLFRKEHGIIGCFWFIHDLCFLLLQVIKKRKFKRFLQKRCKFTKKYNTFYSIKNDFFYSDFIITGSDQVFRPTRDFEERNIFYLDIKTNATKISYAASFGGVGVDKDKEKEIKKYLSSFAYLSVRERSGLESLRKMCFEGQLVLDPVFLLSRKEWKKNSSKRFSNKHNYILYYALINNPTYHKYVEILASLLDKKVIVIGNLDFKPFKKCQYIRTCGPSEFITLINGADYVFTSSFHGVAFSIIFQKQFFSIEEDPILKNRANELMDTFEIPYLNFYEILEMCKLGKINYINYDIVSNKLNAEILKSKKFFNTAMELNEKWKIKQLA